jgi:hypothetical protein
MLGKILSRMPTARRAPAGPPALDSRAGLGDWHRTRLIWIIRQSRGESEDHCRGRFGWREGYNRCRKGNRNDGDPKRSHEGRSTWQVRLSELSLVPCGLLSLRFTERLYDHLLELP